jgi:hypothetical protein
MNKKTTLIAFTIGTITLVSLLVATDAKQSTRLNEEGYTVLPINLQRPVNTYQEGNRVQTESQGMEGRVIDFRGKPADGAEVIAMRSGPGALLRTRPDEEGRFSFIGILAGEYTVFFRKKDGPINPKSPFMTGGTLPPEDILASVQVFEGRMTSGIVIKTGSQWPKLSGKVLDAETNEPIVNSQITLRRVDHPDYYLKFGSDEKGSFTRAVPSVPITVEVVAAGYETWTYPNDVPGNLPDLLRVNIGETKSLTIKLRH